MPICKFFTTCCQFLMLSLFWHKFRIRNIFKPTEGCCVDSPFRHRFRITLTSFRIVNKAGACQVNTPFVTSVLLWGVLCWFRERKPKEITGNQRRLTCHCTNICRNSYARAIEHLIFEIVSHCNCCSRRRRRRTFSDLSCWIAKKEYFWESASSQKRDNSKRGDSKYIPLYAAGLTEVSNFCLLFIFEFTYSISSSLSVFLFFPASLMSFRGKRPSWKLMESWILWAKVRRTEQNRTVLCK